MTWILPLLLIVPLGTAALLAMGLPRSTRSARGARLLTLGSMVATALIGLFAATQVNTLEPGLQLAGRIAWVESLGLELSYGLDGLSMWLVLLMVVLPPVAVLLVPNESEAGPEKPTRQTFAALLAVQATMIGTAIAADALLFYTFFELSLLPTLLLIRRGGVGAWSERASAARTYFFFNFSGSLLTLASILYVASIHRQAMGTWSFGLTDLYRVAELMSPTQQAWVLVGFLAGFGLKTPLFPLHAWLPATHAGTPASGAADVAALVLKLGPYALLRFAIPLCGEGIALLAPVLGGLAVAGILYAGLVGWVQRDAKKLLAYSSISHMGFVLLGLFALDQDTAGTTGAMMYVIAYAASAGGLFACVGILERRFQTRSLRELQGLAKVMPLLACFMVLFTMAAVGLPGLSGFPGEFLTMLGAADGQTGNLGLPYAAAASLGVILAAMYLLWMTGRLLFGPLQTPLRDPDAPRRVDLTRRELVALAPLALLCLLLGFFPNLVLGPVAPVAHALQHTQQSQVQVQADARPPLASANLTHHHNAAPLVRADNTPLDPSF